EDIFRQSDAIHVDQVEEQLVAALSCSRPAGVLVVDPAVGSRPEGHLALVSTREPGQRPPSVGAAQDGARAAGGGRARAAVRWVSRLVALVLLGAAALAALNPSADSLPRLATVHQAQALLAQADETSDP